MNTVVTSIVKNIKNVKSMNNRTATFHLLSSLSHITWAHIHPLVVDQANAASTWMGDGCQMYKKMASTKNQSTTRKERYHWGEAGGGGIRPA